MKTETKKKLENFWYHHKIGVILTLTFGIILAICLGQILNRTEYDLYALYAGPVNINVSSGGEEAINPKLCDAIAQVYGEDDLECSVQSFTYVPAYLAEEYKEQGIEYDNMTNQQTYKAFLNAIANGKEAILLLTPELYSEVKENGALESLEAVFGYVPQSSGDGYGIPLGETGFYRFFDSLSQIPEDTVLCLRNQENPSDLFGIDTGGEKWDKQVDIFKKIIEFEVN